MKRKNIQLAYPFEEKRLNKWLSEKPHAVIVQPKLDGERCRARVDSGYLELLSSEGNEFFSVPHINRILEPIFEEYPFLELDGELYAHGWDFPQIHSVVGRTVNIHPDHEKIDYWVFDVVNRESQFYRLERLSRMVEEINHPSIKLVPHQLASSYDEIIEIFNKSIESGFEGIIVRHPLSIYKRSRSTFMMKFKPKQVDEYEITRVIEAVSKDGEPKEMVGAFEVTDGDQPFKCGAGCLIHSQRVELWNKRNDLVGRTLVVQYQHRLPSGIPRHGLAIKLKVEN